MASCMRRYGPVCLSVIRTLRTNDIDLLEPFELLILDYFLDDNPKLRFHSEQYTIGRKSFFADLETTSVDGIQLIPNLQWRVICFEEVVVVFRLLLLLLDLLNRLLLMRILVDMTLRAALSLKLFEDVAEGGRVGVNL